MKKALKLLAVIALAAVIGFSMAACGGDDDDDGGGNNGGGGTTPGTNPGTGSGGTLTVTDIQTKYNGKYAYFNGTISLADHDIVGSLLGFQSVGGAVGTTAAANSTFSRIANGRVSIPAWLVTADKTLVRYSGNDTFEIIGFTISEVDTLGKNNDPSYYLAGGSFMSVTFTNGSATISKNDARWTEYK